MKRSELAKVLECGGSAPLSRTIPVGKRHGTSSLPEKCYARHPQRLTFIAKRLECVRLAGAFGVEGRAVSQKAGASSRTPSASRKSAASEDCGANNP
jgi:hypothetical protein